MTRITNNDTKPSPSTTIKFLYSYGGKIMPRQIDGKLRYVGGYTRVLAVDRSITHAELIVRFWEACGLSVNLKCKLPSEDLDVLVSVTGDEDLAAVVQEYDRVSPESKIRAVLFPVRSLKTISPMISPVPSYESLVDFSSSAAAASAKPPPHPSSPAANSGFLRNVPSQQQRQSVSSSIQKLRFRYPMARSCRDSSPLGFRFRQNASPR